MSGARGLLDPPITCIHEAGRLVDVVAQVVRLARKVWQQGPGEALAHTHLQPEEGNAAQAGVDSKPQSETSKVAHSRQKVVNQVCGDAMRQW